MTSNATCFDVVVLGAGVVGTNAAYWALHAGKSVCVVDRQPAAGLETSFANGGQISVSHAEPWANPSAPLKVLKWLFDSEAPLLFRPQLDVRQWLWIAQFLVDCLPHRVHRHTIEIVKLATGVKPSAVSRVLTSGSATAFLISALSRSTMSFGVPAGATIPDTVSPSWPGIPASIVD